MAKNIGLQVNAPKRTCHDPNCPFNGNLRVRGKIIDGIVQSIWSFLIPSRMPNRIEFSIADI